MRVAAPTRATGDQSRESAQEPCSTAMDPARTPGGGRPSWLGSRSVPRCAGASQPRCVSSASTVRDAGLGQLGPQRSQRRWLTPPACRRETTSRTSRSRLGAGGDRDGWRDLEVSKLCLVSVGASDLTPDTRQRATAGQRSRGQRWRSTFRLVNPVNSAFLASQSFATTAKRRSIVSSQAEGREFEPRRPLHRKRARRTSRPPRVCIST